MSTGRIQFAEMDGTFVLKFIGEIRLTLCSALDATIEKIFLSPMLRFVLARICMPVLERSMQTPLSFVSPCSSATVVSICIRMKSRFSL